MKYNYIAIEGNIGAGKTTLTNMLCKSFSARVLHEEFEDNPFLAKFYEDRERYGFQVELSFLADRYKQLGKMEAGPNLFQEKIIADFALFKSLVFAQHNLTGDEYLLFKNLFQIMFANLPKPELVIYLHLNIEKLFRNIAIRGRSFEKTINSDYLINVQNSYMAFLKSQRDFPVVILDISELDFINNEQHYQQIKDLFEQDWKPGLNFTQENLSLSMI
ncbi:MAG: deoxynucleoside kinase [Flavobacteriales bacterium]|nr:deoxynucleoside kinase [Flavobacteriales bacterium]